MTSDVYIGKRLSFDGQLCSIRYKGEVKGTKGEWLGVEWDDPSRGKHSGEHGGIKYFECLSKHATAGSFVRPTRKSDPSRSFVEALKAKYASEDFEDPDVEIVFETQEKKKTAAKAPIRFSGKEAEEVGFDKIRKQLANLKELRIVILDGLCMARPAVRLRERQDPTQDAWGTDLADIKDACPKTIELDLSRNLFEEWREVASICEQLSKLKSLRIDGNRFIDMSLTEAEAQRSLKAFADIKTLKMENNLLTWQDLARTTTLFPTLTTFVASSNLYTTLTPHNLNTTITDLSLEDNLFTSLSDVFALTNLPNLQRLILKSNKISTITSSPAQSAPIFPQTLTELDLSYNAIITWHFIDSLATTFPGLNSLRISHNPLFHTLNAADGRALSVEDGYMLTIARLGNLKILNHSAITEKERLNAESYYLSLIAKELNFSPPQAHEEILATHPRYKWLCEEYGEPVVKHEDHKINPNSLAARLIRFKFHTNSHTKSFLVESVQDTFETEVPTSFTVYSLLGIVGKHYGITPNQCKLIWETGDWMPAPTTQEVEEEAWDSDSEGQEDEGVEKGDMIMREVEILPGTRSVGTWVDGIEAVVRVELKERGSRRRPTDKVEVL